MISPIHIPEDKARDGPNFRFNFVQREMTHGGLAKKRKKLVALMHIDYPANQEK